MAVAALHCLRLRRRSTSLYRPDERKVRTMRVGFLIDLNKGDYEQPMPPHRHGRTEPSFPGPEQTVSRQP